MKERHDMPDVNSGVVLAAASLRLAGCGTSVDARYAYTLQLGVFCPKFSADPPDAGTRLDRVINSIRKLIPGHHADRRVSVRNRDRPLAAAR